MSGEPTIRSLVDSPSASLSVTDAESARRITRSIPWSVPRLRSETGGFHIQGWLSINPSLQPHNPLKD